MRRFWENDLAADFSGKKMQPTRLKRNGKAYLDPRDAIPEEEPVESNFVLEEYMRKIGLLLNNSGRAEIEVYLIKLDTLKREGLLVDPEDRLLIRKVELRVRILMELLRRPGGRFKSKLTLPRHSVEELNEAIEQLVGSGAIVLRRRGNGHWVRAKLAEE